MRYPGRKHTDYSARVLGLTRKDGQPTPSFTLRHRAGRQSTIHRKPYSVYPRRSNGIGAIMEAARDWVSVEPRIQELMRDGYGLPWYADGGYPILYYSAFNDYLCGECADQLKNVSVRQPTDYGVIYETDCDIRCDECNKLVAEADEECESCGVISATGDEPLGRGHRGEILCGECFYREYGRYEDEEGLS